MNGELEQKEELTLQNILKYILLIGAFIIMLGVMFGWFGGFNDELNEAKPCYRTVCNKTTLDQFDSCIDLGVEKVGFLSSEHYYLCNGTKITESCIETKQVLVNSSGMIDIALNCEYEVRR